MTRDAAPASLLEGSSGAGLYATPYFGDVDVPGVAARSAGTVGSRCALFDVPADAPAYGL